MAQKRSALTRTQNQGSKKIWIILAAVAGGLILVVAAIIFYFEVGRPALVPKKTITFEPDSAVIGSIQVSQDTLQETAKVLAQRWTILGYDSPMATFEANASNQIIGKVPANVESSFIEQVRATGVVEFVDFGAKAMTPGTRVFTDYTYGAQAEEGTKWHTLMTGGQIHTISVYRNPSGAYQVLFGLTDTGKKILEDYSTQNIDSYLGIVMDKVVVACPRIATPITNGAGVIDGGFTQQEAEILAAIIRSGPLPIPLK
jgi:preprotein translocase subunit SecD